ncbi:MAG: GNAT family N-acetyltransferase [Oscillospiraceae bacterium]|nr:GNAT family N-acetyltransferase [Oscillospiraceae bacterium]
MIIPVSKENERIWGELCASLWPHHTVESFINERYNGEFQNDFLYVLKEEIVAFISLSVRNDYVEGTESSPVGYLEGIYVKPEFRNQGIGKRLVEYGKIWCAEKGCSEFASDCLLENDASRKFHNMIGFKEANTIVCFTMRI